VDERAKSSRGGINRRDFLKTIGVGAVAAGASIAAGRAMSPSSASASTLAQPGNHHLAWVWQFTDDGPPEQIRAQLAFIGAGVLLKTHDSVNWMAKWDKTPSAIDGGAKVHQMRDFFEYGGVPFHAWAVVKGLDPIREAQMAAEVLANGARSLVLDLEPSDGGSFWQGTPESALEFGRELRRLRPDAFVSFAPDPRPWQVDAVPAREFATFCNEVAPQSYWPTFDNSATYRLLRQHGYDIGPGGMTPEFVLDMVKRVFQDYPIPVKPVGSGSQGFADWDRFVHHAQSLGMSAVSVWRYGTANPGVWDVLNAQKPVPNAYYGPDWMKPPPAVDSNKAPNGFTALPVVAPEEKTRISALSFREGASGVQGVSRDLDASSGPPMFNFKAQQASKKKSFWADPTGGNAGR
jgi:hypothetical protein